MLSVLRSIFPAACFLALMALPVCAAPAGDPVLESYVALAIQGDLTAAAGLLDRAAEHGDPEAVSLREAFSARFIEGDGPKPAGIAGPFAESVADEFRSYWRSSLLGQEQLASTRLEGRLHDLLDSAQKPESDDDTVFQAMGRRLTAVGVFHYRNSEPPLHDLFLWLDQSSRRYTVQLTDQSVSLTVHFMGRFILQGWKDYAALGHASTSGWVDGGDLYCVADAYDRNTEHFEVSFLKHEARHLADLDRYPQMDSTELEYRAKLTELAFANRSLNQLLDDFSAKAAPNADAPHAMANWRVLQDLQRRIFGEEMGDRSSRWDRLGPGKVNRAARELLKANTKRHEEESQGR